LVSRSPIVLDCGSHQGAFLNGLQDAGITALEVVCIEANPQLAERLQHAPPGGANVIHAAIVGDERCRRVTLNLSANPEASSLFTGISDCYGTEQQVTVPCITLHDALARFDDRVVDVVKMDVEGAENEVLLRASEEDLGRIKQLCVEFHDVFAPESRPEVDRVRKRLRSLGFAEVNANWPFTDDILFLNLKQVDGGLRLRAQLFLLNSAYRFRGSVMCMLRLLKLK